LEKTHVALEAEEITEAVVSQLKPSRHHLPLITHRSSLLFIAGDVSGDIHAARLAREVSRRHPDWTLHALGGVHLREAIGQSPGARLLGDTSRYGVIGFSSAMAILPRVLRLHRRLLRFIGGHRLDAAVLCDWGAFNGRLLPHLQRLGVPVLYYFPPRSWQKHGNGGLGIVPFVDRVATPFEWSARRLCAAGCRAEWVGHPLLETVRPSQPRAVLRREFGVVDDSAATAGAAGQAKLIALLPGSRALELKYIAPRMLRAVELLRAEYSGAHGSLSFVAAVPKGAAARARRWLNAPWLPIVENRATDVLLACDAALVKSGTVTLEAAVAGAPQAVVYDVPPLLRAQWRLTGMSRKVPFVSMPNIILERRAVPELLGDDCRAAPMAHAVRELLGNVALRARMSEDYAAVRRALGAELLQAATDRTATMLEEMLAETREDPPVNERVQ
jgi:lipid-A-disaccharide synthase